MTSIFSKRLSVNSLKSLSLSKSSTRRSVGRNFVSTKPTFDDSKVNEETILPKHVYSDYEPIPVSYEDISRAHYRLKKLVKRTHCDFSTFLSEECKTKVYMKKDFMQFTGSFKERGACNALLMLSENEKKLGVVAASAGNHAQALAWHGKKLNIPVTCVMPTIAPFAKVDKCRKFGANVVLHGPHIGASKEYALETFSDMKYINGYDDKAIIAGAGTMGVEILEQVPDVNVVICPVGGAGLIAGVSLAIKTLRPDVEVIGVEAENCPSFQAALEAGKPVNGFIKPSIADGLSVPVVGTNAFNVAKKHVDYTVSVTEKGISIAMLRLIETEKLVVEGGGATCIAAILPGGPLYNKLQGKKVVCILGGGNIDTTLLGRVIDRGLASDSRLVRFHCAVSDRPGGICELSKILFSCNVSIKDIYHERAWLHTRVDQVVVRCVVETMGVEHMNELFRTLKEAGYGDVRADTDAY